MNLLLTKNCSLNQDCLNMGLLSRASTLDKKEKIQGLAFSDFIIKHSLKICALLEKKESDYFVKNSIGFDGNSIISAISTADFWNGICPVSKKIYSFTNQDEINPLLQLFSLNIKDNIKNLYIYKNAKSQILLSTEIITNKIADDIELLDNSFHICTISNLNSLIQDNSVVLKFNIDYSEAVESFITAKMKSDIKNKSYIQSALLNEIYNRFICYYNSPDSTVLSGINTLKTVIITDKTYSIELIANHLILNIKDLLEHYAELIIIDFSGTAESCAETQAFLQS